MGPKKRHIVFCTDTLSCSPSAGRLCFSSPPRHALTQNALHLVSLTVFKEAYYFVFPSPTLPVEKQKWSCFFFLSSWVPGTTAGLSGVFHSLASAELPGHSLPRCRAGAGAPTDLHLSWCVCTGTVYINKHTPSVTPTRPLPRGKGVTLMATLDVDKTRTDWYLGACPQSQAFLTIRTGNN